MTELPFRASWLSDGQGYNNNKGILFRQDLNDNGIFLPNRDIKWSTPDVTLLSSNNLPMMRIYDSKEGVHVSFSPPFMPVLCDILYQNRVMSRVYVTAAFETKDETPFWMGFSISQGRVGKLWIGPDYIENEVKQNSVSYENHDGVDSMLYNGYPYITIAPENDKWRIWNDVTSNAALVDFHTPTGDVYDIAYLAGQKQIEGGYSNLLETVESAYIGFIAG